MTARSDTQRRRILRAENETHARERAERRTQSLGFAARYPGTCVLCDHDFATGETICSWNRAEHRYAHKTCVLAQ